MKNPKVPKSSKPKLGIFKKELWEKIILHPFLIAIFPLLFWYVHNQDLVDLTFALKLIALSLGFGILVYGLCLIVGKDKTKSALLASLILIIIFNYRLLAKPLVAFFASLDLYKFQLVIITSILITLAMILYRFLSTKAARLKATTLFLNVAALAIVSMNFIQGGIFLANNQKNIRSWAYDPEAAMPVAGPGSDQTKRDIYLLVPDRYARADTLKNFYKFDNSTFIEKLKKRGFVLPKDSYANYQTTALSMSSSLNMQHITFLADDFGPDANAQSLVIERLWLNNKVGRFLRGQGYKYVNMFAWWPKSPNPHADISFYFDKKTLNWFGNEFVLGGLGERFLEDTILHPFLSAKSIQNISWLPKIYSTNNSGKPVADMESSEKHAAMFEYQMQAIKKAVHLPGPKFTYLHMLMPHNPYIYDSNCNFIPLKITDKQPHIKKYRNQLSCANKNLLATIDYILQNSKNDPIILLQADEGPYSSSETGKSKFNWFKASSKLLKEKNAILSAYRLPTKSANKLLYPTISPVNSWRVIFNAYFDTNLDLLADRTFSSQDKKHLYRFDDITNELR